MLGLAFVSLLLGGLGVGIGLLAHSSFKQWRLILDTPTSRCGGAQAGLIELKGQARAEGEAVLTSPLTNQRCVYYRVHVEEYVRRGNKSRWTTRVSDVQTVPTVLDDGSGRAKVDLTKASLELRPDRHEKQSAFEGLAPEVKAFIESKYQLSTKGILLNRPLRVTETALALNDDVYLLGRAEWRGKDLHVVPFEKVFVISDKPEEEVAAASRNSFLGLTALAVFFFGMLAVFSIGPIRAWLGR